MGIYGNMMLYFPEQFVTLTTYEMTPDMNGGWSRTSNSDLAIRCVIQNTGGGSIRDSNGNLVRSDSMELWTETGGLMGRFVTTGGMVYRLDSQNEWNKEGGFYRYRLDKVVGNNGTESDTATWNTGSGSFC